MTRPRLLSLCAATLLLAGCAATVDERHYFATYATGPSGESRPANFFRLEVKGKAGMSNARYLAGYYDERAIDLFFNELKAPDNQKLFQDAAKIPGTDEKLKPLGPAMDNGAFVLILSTNADSIANAIGSFAESQIVAQAFTRVINKERYKDKMRSDVDTMSRSAQADVLIKKLELHLAGADGAASSDAARKSYLRALFSLAQAAGYRGAEFPNFEEARKWFNAEADQSRVVQ